jgi:hypothetical protein
VLGAYAGQVLPWTSRRGRGSACQIRAIGSGSSPSTRRTCGQPTSSNAKDKQGAATPPRGSQADSADSIPVTRSTPKGQIRDLSSRLGLGRWMTGSRPCAIPVPSAPVGSAAPTRRPAAVSDLHRWPLAVRERIRDRSAGFVGVVSVDHRGAGTVVSHARSIRSARPAPVCSASVFPVWRRS